VNIFLEGILEMLTDEELERYQRQILVFNKNGQEILKSKKILQVGAGGLGSPLLLYLVAAGIGEIVLFEYDEVSLSNLGRQILYNTEEIGKSKPKLAASRLNRLNPHVKLTIVEKRLTHETAKDYMEGVNYLVDASDNFETKFLINDLGLEYDIPFTIAGIQSFEGQLISVIPHKTACYRCIFGNNPIEVDKKPIPVMGPTCGVVGSLEANEVLKGLLNHGKMVLNQLLIISLDDADFNKIPIKINPKCLCQSEK
jgi:molybdopterin-synthase adenylyltransferase